MSAMHPAGPYLLKCTGGYAHHCAGCNAKHILPTGEPYHINWSFNGDLEKPSFSPSFKHTIGKAGSNEVCHYTITDGVIHYYSDTTAHLMRGNFLLEKLDLQGNPIETYAKRAS